MGHLRLGLMELIDTEDESIGDASRPAAVALLSPCSRLASIPGFPAITQSHQSFQRTALPLRKLLKNNHAADLFPYGRFHL